MVEAAREALEKLNEALAEGSPYRLGIAAPDQFVPADVNARFMPKNQYEQLVQNIKRDRNLSSLPLVWHDRDGQRHILSGHHRIDAAKDAGVPWLLYLYTDADLTEEERTAIQISHNSLAGVDDLGILKRQWESIRSVELKLYSGLDDHYFKTFEPITLNAFNERDLQLIPVELQFLPREVEELEAAIRKIGTSKRLRLIGAADQFEPFSEVLMRFKEKAGILNSATAFAVMIRIIDRYCDWIEAAEQDPDPEAPTSPEERDLILGVVAAETQASPEE